VAISKKEQDPACEWIKQYRRAETQFNTVGSLSYPVKDELPRFHLEFLVVV
jgi:hypothetical protein